MNFVTMNRAVAVILFVMAGAFAEAGSFRVSKVSCTDDGLRVEVQTDWPEGSNVNLCITDDQDGFNCISATKYFTVHSGRFVLAFSTDLNDEPFRPGRYWVSIARALDDLPRVAVLPIRVSKR